MPDSDPHKALLSQASVPPSWQGPPLGTVAWTTMAGIMPPLSLHDLYSLNSVANWRRWWPGDAASALEDVRLRLAVAVEAWRLGDLRPIGRGEGAVVLAGHSGGRDVVSRPTRVSPAVLTSSPVRQPRSLSGRRPQRPPRRLAYATTVPPSCWSAFALAPACRTHDSERPRRWRRLALWSRACTLLACRPPATSRICVQAHSDET